MRLKTKFYCRHLFLLVGALAISTRSGFASPDVTYSAQSLRQQAFQHILDGGDPNFEGKKVLELYQLAIDKAEKDYGPNAGYTAQLYFEMGNYAFDIANFGVANTGLTRALQINPNLSTARLRLAQLDEVCEKPDKAQDQMRQLLMRHGDNKAGQNRLIALMQKTNPLGATRQAYLFQHQESSNQVKLLAPAPPLKLLEKPVETKPAAPAPKAAEKPAQPTPKKTESAPSSKVQSVSATTSAPASVSPSSQTPSSISSALLMRAHRSHPPEANPPQPKPASESSPNADPSVGATVSASAASSPKKITPEDEAQVQRIERMKKEIQLYEQLKALQSADPSLNFSSHSKTKKVSTATTQTSKKHHSNPSPPDSSAKMTSSHSGEGHKVSHKLGGGTMLIPPPPPTGVAMPFPMPMPMPARPDLISPSIQIKTDAKLVKQKPKAKPAQEAKASAEEKPAQEAKAEKPPHVAPTGSAEEDPEFLLKWAGTKKKKKE